MSPRCEGAHVVTCGRRNAPGVGEVAHVQADLALSGEPERFARRLPRLGGLDVLVNNVGVARRARFEDVSDEEWDAYWQLNVMSYVRAIRAALPALRRRRRDRQRLLDRREASFDLNAALLRDEGRGSLSRLVADLYASDGVRCNAVTPGPTATDRGWERADWPSSRAIVTRCSRRSVQDDRFGDSRLRIAAVVVFLCSERALCHGRGVERRRRHRPDHLMTDGPRAVGATLLAALAASQSALAALNPLLPDVARDLDVSIATAGQLRTVSGLAAGLRH